MEIIQKYIPPVPAAVKSLKLFRQNIPKLREKPISYTRFLYVGHWALVKCHWSLVKCHW
jgi:hypothetical protein